MHTEKALEFFAEYKAALDGEFNSTEDARRCNEKCVALCRKLEELGFTVLSHIVYVLERELLPKDEERVTIEQQFTLHLINLRDWQSLRAGKSFNLRDVKSLKTAEAKARIKASSKTVLEQSRLLLTPQDNDFLREAKIKIG